jgi:uncharacterized protein (DUF1778 family)
MSTARKRKDNNINIRAALNEKELIKKAADMSGLDTSTFMLFHSIEAAKKTISQTDVFVLSRRDAELVADALLNPPAPNEALKRAFKRHKEIFGNKV